MASKEKGRQGQTKADKETSGPTKMTSEDKPLKINRWDGSAVKNALDDSIKKVMKEEYGYVEDFKLIDLRLFISTLACSFSLFALGYDYLFPFPASKIVLALCAISYFILMCVLTVFSLYVEGNTFMVALEKDKAGVGVDNVWKIGSSMPRFSNDYTLVLSYTNGQTKATESSTMKKSIAEYFDEEGTLVMDRLFQDVSKVHAETCKSKRE